MIGYGRGGGGGGFGGFPYRSSHQQGQDGRGGNNRGGRGRGRGGGRQQRKQSRPRSQNTNLISIAAELNIPPEHRRVIVGRGGTTLKWLKEVSGVNIFVPHVQKNNRRGRSTQQKLTLMLIPILMVQHHHKNKLTSTQFVSIALNCHQSFMLLMKYHACCLTQATLTPISFRV